MSKNRIGDKKVINASEIGQYLFCNISWMLQKQGFKPDSIYIKKGEDKHIEHGIIIDNTIKTRFRSKIIGIIGILFILFSFLYLFFEVI